MSNVKHQVNANALIKPNHTNPDQLDRHARTAVNWNKPSTAEYMLTDTVHPYSCIAEMHLLNHE